MASIRQRVSKSGKVSYQVQVRREGFKPLNATKKTRAEAERWAREQEAKIDRGGYEDVGSLRRQTVKELMLRFLQEKVPQRRGRRWETVRINFLVRDDFAQRRLDQDVAGALRDWVARRLTTASAATVVRDMNLLSTIFRTAAQEWAVPLSVNPVSLVKRPVVDKTPKGQLWTPALFERLRVAQGLLKETRPHVADGEELTATSLPIAADYVLPALELSIETAMRRGELCGFKVEDIDLEARTIWLPPELTKTGVGRHALLSTRAVEIVKELLKLPRRAGERRLIPLNPDTLGLRFRQLREAAGLTRKEGRSLRLHDGRHTATTNASEVFDNVLELAKFTGHVSLQTLKGYYHPDPTRLAKKLG